MHCNLFGEAWSCPAEEGRPYWRGPNHDSNLSEPDRALLTFAVKLGVRFFGVLWEGHFVNLLTFWFVRR